MWTIDANRCPSCPRKDTCEDRKAIIKAMSPVINGINLDDSGEHADGIIILACKR